MSDLYYCPYCRERYPRVTVNGIRCCSECGKRREKAEEEEKK